jgi:light-regulated signal transduction histidine kinase (bacteriophytochrome)
LKTTDEARKVLNEVTFKIQMPAKDLAEVNLELMKKLGRSEEAAAFQYILDHDLSEDFQSVSRFSKKYLSVKDYVQDKKLQKTNQN